MLIPIHKVKIKYKMHKVHFEEEYVSIIISLLLSVTKTSFSCCSAFRSLLQTEMNGPQAAREIGNTERIQLGMFSPLKTTENKTHVKAKLPGKLKQ